MKFKLLHLTACIGLCLSSTAHANVIPEHQRNSEWFENSLEIFETASSSDHHNTRTAKNVIVVVGSGMGVTTLTASRIYEGQKRGELGEDNYLSFERFPYTSLLKTYSTNMQVGNASSAVSSLMTGVKSKTGLIGLADSVNVGDCGFENDRLINLFELASHQNKATGIVSNARLTSPIVAASYAHTSDMTWEREVATECKSIATDIATQFVETAPRIDVTFAGGSRELLSQENGGSRLDRDLVEAWEQSTSGQYIDSRDDFITLPGKLTSPVLGLFAPSHLGYAEDRELTSEPSLPEMANKAVELLSDNSDGFFMYVSSIKSGQAHSAGNAERALSEVVELSNTITAIEKQLIAKGILNETLIVVTTDQSMPLTISGYPYRGRNILGNVDDTPIGVQDGVPHTILSYPTGPGADYTFEAGQDGIQRRDPAETNVQMFDIDYLQQALVPLDNVESAADDVVLFAKGPGAYLTQGNAEQHSLFHIINTAAQFGAKKYQTKKD
ncbi:alkaline phosphatase [Vibrio agarivorans]|uniref:Alkaline phosphatase n=1 Tax=Vibrio agarivorans TaxID=153622 RepID=A0ABT7Y622_9VIBR|nr:alkaline phosphatase [Vibrio agarivorans]